MLEILASLAIVALVTISLFPMFQVGSENISIDELQESSAELRTILYEYPPSESQLYPVIESELDGDTVTYFHYSPSHSPGLEQPFPFPPGEPE